MSLQTRAARLTALRCANCSSTLACSPAITDWAAWPRTGDRDGWRRLRSGRCVGRRSS